MAFGGGLAQGEHLQHSIQAPAPSQRSSIGPGPGFQVVSIEVGDAMTLGRLVALTEEIPEIEIWSDHIELGSLEVRMPIQAAMMLDRERLPYRVVVPDLQADYDARFTQRGGSFGSSFRTYEEHFVYMARLTADYPHLARMMSLGVSVQGRPMWALRVSGSPFAKPGVLVHGVQHGNEIHGAVVVAELARILLEEYQSDPEIRALVDGLEFYLLPIMNPDGYITGTRHNFNRFDLNRDWTGPGAPNRFTQPETQAMRDFLREHPNVRAHFDLHGYRADIMWPWGHTNDLCPDHSTFHLLAEKMHDAIRADGGPAFPNRGPIYPTIYPVLGGSIDHSYDVHGIWGFVFELTGEGGPRELEPWAAHVNRGLIDFSWWIWECGRLTKGGPGDCNTNGTRDTCEVDVDSDGIIDPCDGDIDNDGYANAVDDCVFSPVTGLSRLGGVPIGDFDGDCQVRLSDYARAADCPVPRGPGIPPPSRSCGTLDFDLDADLDLLDLAWLFNQFE